MHSVVSINVLLCLKGINARFSTKTSIQPEGSLHLTTVDSLRPLLGRTLVLVAHPDDEAVGCGALLQRMSDPIVVYATDGAPRSDYFWKSYGSREKYAAVRAGEAERALAAIGVLHFHSLCEDPEVADQELYLDPWRAYDALAQLIEAEMPEAILSHAYEGGHPDHDVCSFLAAVAGSRFDLPVWEMPLYHRAGGEVQRQAFIGADKQQVTEISREELAGKRGMYEAYASQAAVLADFGAPVERFREMSQYDFARVPHAGVLNYEAWQWPIKGTELCRVFGEFLQHKNKPARVREWGTVA
jgi:LmbE family N-acetylglucosaminyl deacetylase